LRASCIIIIFSIMEFSIKKYKTFKETKSDQYIFYPDEDILKSIFLA